MSTESILKDWIAAYATQDDANKFISLFGDDAEWMDWGEPMFKESGPQKIKDMEEIIRSSAHTFKVKITSYFISPDERFAALEGLLTDHGKTVPSAVILEFKDGKIHRETWYHD
jgi:hypothetical protein